MITAEQAANEAPMEDLSHLTSGDLSRFWVGQIISDDEFVTEIERRFGVQVPARRPQ
jgi:hypothetical protein